MDLSYIPTENRLSVLETENQIITYIEGRIKSLPNHSALKADVEVIKLIGNCIENCIDKKSKINKKELLLSIHHKIFTDNATDRAVVADAVEFLWANKQFVKIGFLKKFIHAFVRLLKRKF
jgi:hypothetical protein